MDPFIYFKRCQEIYTKRLELNSWGQFRYAMLAGKYEQTKPALSIFCQRKTSGTFQNQFVVRTLKSAFIPNLSQIDEIKWARCFEKKFES